jgi:tetratricopeptide (TPR) repeat protein
MLVRATLVSAFLFLFASAAAASGASAADPACARGASALERANPTAAETAYRAVLEGEPESRCAIAGLGEVTTQVHEEEKLCAEAKVAAAKEETEVAKKMYADALALNTDSECATSGLKPAAATEEKEAKTGAEKYESNLKAVFASIGLWLVAVLVAIGVLLLVVFFWRRRRASLLVEAFGDESAGAKVGAVMAGLIRKRLSDLSARRSQSSGQYKLDLVVADVELLAENDSLESALKGLSEVSQLKFVVALLSLFDQIFSRRLLVKGELAPAGDEGCGVVIGLESGRKGVVASGALWSGKAVGESIKPGDYYVLAERSAAWIQYEAAQSLASDVGLLTNSAQSFSLISEALAKQRLAELDEAALLYAEALKIDPENVVGLINLSVIVARDYGHYDWAVGLLGLAQTALVNRYEERE